MRIKADYLMCCCIFDAVSQKRKAGCRRGGGGYAERWVVGAGHIEPTGQIWAGIRPL